MDRSSRPLFSWLHLSDIHFGHGVGAEHEHRELVLDTFLSDLRQFESWGTPRPDAVFVTGDIGFSGDMLGRDEYGQAARWLRQLARGLELQERDVYLVPGNHDVARVTLEDDAETFQLIQALRTQQRRIDDVLHDEHARRLLVERMRNYLELAAQFGPASADGSRDRLFWSHRPKTRGDLLLRVVGFNTALLANDDTDRHQLSLGRGQLNRALHQRKENELIIALSHHPPGWLGDGGEVEKWLEQRADILLSGHVHEQESLMRQRGGGRRFVQVAAGALHEVADTAGAPGRFTFSFGAISVGTEGRLQLQVWPFTWTKRHNFRPDQDQLEGPGHYFNVHQLECLAPSRSQATAGAWEPGAFTEALAAYKRACAKDSRIRRLDLSRLVGITRGPHQTELDLLDFVVAPSLQDGDEEDGELAARLRRQQRVPGLDSSERREIARKLEQLEQGWRNHQGRHHDDDARKVELISFAEALHRHKRITVIGEPGAGKSVLTRLVLLACTDEDAGARARARLIADDEFNSAAVETVRSLRELLPVHLTLGKLGLEFAGNQQLSLAEFIRLQILEKKEDPALREGLGELIGAGRIFLLCDGLDEVPEEQRERVVQEIAALAEHSPEMRVLVTSRPHGYHPRVRGFAHTRLAPLHHRQQRVLVSRLHRLVETLRGDDAQGLARAHRRTEALLRAIQTRREWYELSSNPLLLTLSALTNTDADDVPKHRVIVFENFVQTILKHWRSTLSRSSTEMNRILDAWSSVASELVRLELRYGVARGRIQRMLTQALEAAPVPAPIDAETALHLALEAGLVREDDETVAFWHSTFAEFLAARFLTGHGPGAAQRILDADNPSTLVLQLAAARLHHVFDDEEQAAELANGLLARDESRDGRLFRPGLSAVSACLSDGVGFHEDVVERVWSHWVELLEQTPPSPLWVDFYQLTRQAPPARLPASLAARFARLDDRGVYEVREGLARIVAPSAGEDPTARAACERWLEQTSGSVAKRHGAFGLACAGVWTEPVIDALGQFSSAEGLAPDIVGERVRRGGPPLLDQLRALARVRFPSDESSSAERQRNEQVLSERRLSAACLLAASGQGLEDVIEVMRLTLLSHHSSFRRHEAMAVMGWLCESHAPSRQALLRWLLDESTLGRNALEIVREVAPRIEHLPDEVLELTAEVEEKRLMELETLLVSIGEERRALVDTLRRWLEDEREERRIRAARVLRRLAPREHLLHAALRRGLRSQDDATRARWVHLSFGLDDELSRTALETMLDCTLSPDPLARQTVYEGMYWEMQRLKWTPFEAWFARVSAPGVPESARLDAVKFVARTNKDEAARAVPLLRELRDTTVDAEVRREAALQLFYRNEVDEHTAAVVAENAVREGWSIARLELLEPFAATVVPIILRQLSNEDPPTDAGARRREPEYLWRFVLEKLVDAAPSCAHQLLDGLESPGADGRIAETTLLQLLDKSSAVRDVIRERIERAAAGRSRHELPGFVGLGLGHQETRPSALQALRVIDPRELTQSLLLWLALRLYQVKEQKDAARFWRHALDGKDMELSLRAATALVVRFPDDAPAWLQPALTRLLGSPAPAQRVDAGRLALRCGLLEQEALAALAGCLELADQRYRRGEENGVLWWWWDWREVVHGSGHDTQLEWLRPSEARVDLEAMHALCTYRPDVGLPRLTAWLDAAEMARFRSAVAILAGQDGYRDRVTSALEERLRSGPLEQIGSITFLVDEHGLHSTEMTKLLLTRYTPDLPEFHEVERCLVDWLQSHPEGWSVLVRQEPERRVELGRLLQYGLSVSSDAISFAVGLALSEPRHPRAETAEDALEKWCTASKEEDAALKGTRERPPRLPPEGVRARIREVLSEHAAPSDLFALLRFDRLAELAELSTDRRIEVLHRALEIDIAESADEEFTPLYLLEQQVNAGLLLLELGSRDERIQPLLESALHQFAEVSTLKMFQIAYALPKQRLADPALRRLLIRGTIAPVGYFIPKQEEMLGLLEDAGLSPSELLDVQLARLGLEGRPEWTAILLSAERKGWSEAPTLIDALEGLGCPPERRASILVEFVSRYAETLPTETRWALAARADLPDSTALKLLSSVIATPDGLRDIESTLELWQKRFAPRGKKRRERHELWRYGEITYLPGRFNLLAKLSEVKTPALLDEVLTEWVAVPADGLLRLYREARDKRDALSDARWIELKNWLSVRPGEKRTSQLAKEWLTWGLWRAVEPQVLKEEA